MKARIYLATTAGPVRVERLTRERAQQSAVCLGRTTKVLAVSADYDAFVKQPSGVIEREFGPLEPGAFRLDVDGPIDDGDSWQLGVFAAHMLVQNHALAGLDDPADRAVWLTGAVHNDLTVAPVEHIPEKLRASNEVFAALAKEGVPLTLVLPPGGKAHAGASNLPPEIVIVEVASTGDLVPVLDIVRPALSAPLRPVKSVVPTDRRRRRGKRMILIASLLLLAAAGAILQIWREMEALQDLVGKGDPAALADALDEAENGRRPDLQIAAWLIRGRLAREKPVSVLQIHERRAPAGRSCAAVHFGNVEATLSPVPPDPSGAFRTSGKDGLCGLEISIESGPGPIYAAADLEVLSGKYIETRPMPGYLSGTKPWSGVARWTIDLPRRLAEPFAYRVVLVAWANPVDNGSGAWRKIADSQANGRFTGLGLLVVTAAHRVDP